LTGAIRLIYESLGKGTLEEKKVQELLLKKEVGKGFVFILTLEYSEWARNITQGKPNRSDGKFSKRTDWNMQGIQTPDLRTDHPEPFAFVPVLDVFDQTLFGYVKDKLRIPAWWYYPEAYSGAFVLTFDEDWFGNKAKRIYNKGAPATWFVVDDSDIDTEAIDFLRREGDTIQFHWNRFLIHINKFGLHFCRRKAKEQVDKLEKKAAIRPVICRIHYLRWDTDFDNLFFVMKEAGMQVDSSFGPGRGQHGYRFGTGFPYFVCDKEGRPIGIEEIPFQIHEPMGGGSSEDHLRLIEEADRHFHTTVVGLFHPYYCLEGSRSYESFTELLNYLDKKPIWKTNLEALTNYWDKRRKTKFLSFFENRNLIIEVSGLNDEGMTLRLPDLENMEKIALDGKEICVQEKLILDEGEHSIEICYQN